jgi:hypothetical protein
MAVLAPHPAHAQTRVQVLETFPAGDAVTLHRNQDFYLHLHYTSDQPVHIWAQPYFQGKPAKAGSNPSRVHPAGSGDALGWFFLFDPGTQVDEVRIRAGDGSIHGTPVVARYPVEVSGDDSPADTASPPGWVAQLGAADAAAQRADQRQRANAPISAGAMALFSGFMLAIAMLGLIGLAAPAWGLWRWRGGWRIAAAVPAAAMAFVVLRIVTATAIDPTSHNLWPFEILVWGGLSCLWMLVLAMARRLARGAQA